MATKNYSRVKLVIDDPYERFVEGENFSGSTFTYSAEDKTATVKIPKKRERNDDPVKVAEGVDTGMYFSKRKSGGYGFVMTVNVPLFKKMGEDGLVEEFRQCVHNFLAKIGA